MLDETRLPRGVPAAEHGESALQRGELYLIPPPRRLPGQRYQAP